MKNEKQKFRYVLIALLIFLLYFVNEINPIDSDSGREIKRALEYDSKGYDGGPFTSQILYSILIQFTNVENTIKVLNILNIFIFISMIYLLIKILELKKPNTKDSTKILLILLIFSLSSVFSTIWYVKPYLLTLFLVIVAIFLFSLYISEKNKNYLILSSVLFSVSILTKNHAYPFIIFPLVYLGISYLKNKKFNLNEIFCYTLPAIVVLSPILLYNFYLFGLKFWHYPNGWFFDSGVNKHIAEFFWEYPKERTLSYYIGQWEFIKKTIPYIFIVIFSVIYLNKKNLRLTGYFLLLSLLAVIPFLVGVIPFYNVYNYFFAVFILMVILTFLESFKISKLTRILIISIIIIFSTISIISNFEGMYNSVKNEKQILNDFEEFEKKDSGAQKIILSRDYKLQPFTNNYLFLGIEELDKDSLINLFSYESGNQETLKSLKKYNVCFILLYKDTKYNEEYFNELLSIFQNSFQIDKYNQLDELFKIYDGEELVVYKLKKCEDEN